MAFHGGDKILHALLEKALSVQTVDREVPVASINKMFGDHLPDEVVVHADKGERTLQKRRAQLDCRQPRCGDHIGHFLREGTREDAVAIPIFKPGRWTGLQRAQLDEA